MAAVESPNRVREFREKAGLTQAQLASAADVTVGTISQVELGNVSPRTATALAIARALQATVEELFYLPSGSSDTLETTGTETASVAGAGGETDASRGNGHPSYRPAVATRSRPRRPQTRKAQR